MCLSDGSLFKGNMGTTVLQKSSLESVGGGDREKFIYWSLSIFITICPTGS